MYSSVDIAIIGAGVVGLAIAYELSRNADKSIAVLEKNKGYGQETSSRNSEVIHSGVYYPADMLKTSLCMEGNQLLYHFCSEHRVANKRLGKLIVGYSSEDSAELEKLFQNGKNNGVDVQYLDMKQISFLEPDINVQEALYLPATGIIDSYGLMQQLYYRSKANEVSYLFDSELLRVEFKNPGYLLKTRRETIMAETVINAAGLNSDHVASLTGIDLHQHDYAINPCKGEYYRLKKRFLINHLIYPLPAQGVLGIHITPDMQGNLRLGPNAYYVNEIDYHMDESHKQEFLESLKRFLPSLSIDDLTPDCTGIRPKLQRPAGPIRDFVINEESDKGFPNFINLIGIESPGLTSSLAIAHYVKKILKI